MSDVLLATLTLMLGRLFSRFNKILAGQKELPSSKVEQLRSDHKHICRLVHVSGHFNVFKDTCLV